jgi:hypothetical protein
MEDLASLRQTVTHLFDAVKHGKQAQELELKARSMEQSIETSQNRLDNYEEELSEKLSSINEDQDESIRDFSGKVAEFLRTAKGQASAKMQKTAKVEIDRELATASSERDKALKSLEAYLATSPLPIVDSSISIRLIEGTYNAVANYESEGGLKYTFGLGSKNSKSFHHDFSLAQLGHELKVPVRFSRALLKGRVPGFERLDQYVLAEAELSGGKLRAGFVKVGDDAKIKVVTSGFEKQDFISVEYTDQLGTVNITNDFSLMAHIDLDGLKGAMAQTAGEMTELSSVKVALLRLELEGEDLIDSLDCYKILEMVMNLLGPKYRSVLEKLPDAQSSEKEGEELSLPFVRQRLRVLGEFAKPVSQLLGVKERTHA